MKRGISAVVATVLIILITVAAVTIIWNAIIPMIKESISIEEERVDLSINTFEGYTVWNDETQTMSVHIKRGGDDVELSGVQFIFTRGGISEIFISDEIPGKNQMKVYNFDLTALGGEPDSVSIAPIFAEGNAEIIGTITDTVEDVDVPEGEVAQEELIVVGTSYVCADARAKDYCSSFDGYKSEGAGVNCINAGCRPYEGWCDGTDINKDGVVGDLDSIIFTEERGRGCDSNLPPIEYNECIESGEACSFDNNWCNGADINKDGVVGIVGVLDQDIITEEWGRGCNSNLVPSKYNECIESGEVCSFDNNWCNGADIDGSGDVGQFDRGKWLANFGATECGLDENIFEDCRFVSSCSVTTKSECENVGGCLWINPSLPSCENPIMQATWSDSGDILADEAFDEEEIGASSFLSVVELNGDYVLKATGVEDTHIYEKAVIKNLDNLQSWGGIVYVNLKDLSYTEKGPCYDWTTDPCPTDMAFIGAYTDSSWDNRDLGIVAYNEETYDYNYLYMKALRHSSMGSSFGGKRFDTDGSNINYPAYEKEPWPDRWIKIEWVFSSNSKFYGRVDDGAWKKIWTGSIDLSQTPFKRFALGWISSYNGGSVYFKNVTLYPEECIPDWMNEEY